MGSIKLGLIVRAIFNNLGLLKFGLTWAVTTGFLTGLALTIIRFLAGLIFPGLVGFFKLVFLGLGGVFV